MSSTLHSKVHRVICSECPRRLCSYVCFLWNVIYGSVSALEPAINLPSGSDVCNEEDFGIDREDNSIVPHSRGSAIYTDQRFRKPCSLRLRRDGR
jgi:hypothetical protein